MFDTLIYMAQLNQTETPNRAAEYTIVNGVIRDPGKFEGEPEYCPYFYELANESGSDETVYWTSEENEDSEVAADVFHVNAEDVERFPSLGENGIKTVSLKYDSQGFVICQTWNCNVQDTVLNIRDWMGV